MSVQVYFDLIFQGYWVLSRMAYKGKYDGKPLK